MLMAACSAGVLEKMEEQGGAGKGEQEGGRQIRRFLSILSAGVQEKHFLPPGAEAQAATPGEKRFSAAYRIPSLCKACCASVLPCTAAF